VGVQHLATYLNDHLAGAASAIDLMRHIEQAHAGDPVGALVGRIRRDVEADREELRRLIARLHAGESVPRQAVAWLGERMARLKLRIDDPSGGALRLFESLEAISLGIEGKNALWHALAASAPGVPDLQGVDYDRLIARGQEQRGALEPARLDAGRAAFSQS
jgi:hypothetical protein